MVIKKSRVLQSFQQKSRRWFIVFLHTSREAQPLSKRSMEREMICPVSTEQSVTLGKVLVQVELESSASEAEDLGSLGQEAGEVQVIVAQWIRQQEGPHFSSLAFWTRRS